ncbi:hypothetical protein FACS1894130_12350 [Spirochaetia bacterium]|nr:hypothetical protein FACS1894130_12350 [Spirochaetia bacterium]
MGYFLKTVFKSGKFCFGFGGITIILLLIIMYPLFDTRDPLDMAGGFFERPNLAEYLNRNKEGGKKRQARLPKWIRLPRIFWPSSVWSWRRKKSSP